jgi:hypothetical protein
LEPFVRKRPESESRTADLGQGTALRRGLRRGVHACWVLFRISIPTYVAMDVLQRLGVIDAIGRFCGPVMGFFRLPGEAAVAVLLGLTVNVIAATAALGALGLSSGQILTLGLMIGLAHALLVETAVLKAAGGPAVKLLIYRIVIAVVVGFVASRFLIGVHS